MNSRSSPSSPLRHSTERDRLATAASAQFPDSSMEPDSAAPGVFIVEDEPQTPLRSSLYFAAGLAVASAVLFGFASYAVGSFSIAFWLAVLATVLLIITGILVFVAASRAPDPLARTAFTAAGMSVLLLAVAAAVDWFLLPTGVLSLAVLSSVLSSQVVLLVLRAAPAVFAGVAAAVVCAVALRAQLLPLVRSESLKLPSKVQRIERGVAKLVATRDVREGNVLLIVAGERLPVDGVISDGNAQVDESALTGTLTPVVKVVGMHVFAGSTVRSGRLLVLVKAIGADTMLAQLQSRPADELEQTLHARAVRSMRSALVSSSVLAAALGTLGFLQSGFVALAAGVALGFAPGAFVALGVSGLGTRSLSVLVARTGARVRTPHALARIAEADTLVLERTGVLTSGAVLVEHVVSFRPYTQQQILNTAAALESHSEHRHAKAIVSFARGMGAVGFQRVDDVVEETSGISARLNGKRVVAGNLAYVRKHDVTVPEETLEHAAEGKTIILVAADGIAMGYIALREPTRGESNAVVAALHSFGVEVLLLTGEHEAVAKAHATAVGVSHVISDASAAVKDETYARLRSEGKRVIAVSTVPRPEASVSIVVFAQRSTAASVAGADIIVRSDDLSTLEHLVAAVAAEKKAARETTRRAWLTGAFSACAVALPLGGVLLVPFGIIGTLLALRASR